MKKVVSTLLVLGLLLTTMVWNVYAEDAAPAPVEKAKAALVSYGVFPGGSLLGSSVHEQAYLTYLVEEYSPDTLQSWEEAFAKRNEAVKKSKEQLQTTVKGKEALKEVAKEAVFEAEKIAGQPLTITFKGQTNEDGTVSEDSVLRVSKAPNLTVINKDFVLPEEMKAKIELYQKFEKAVADHNAEEIKALLPDLLTDYNKTTEQMANLKVFVKNAADPKQE